MTGWAGEDRKESGKKNVGRFMAPTPMYCTRRDKKGQQITECIGGGEAAIWSEERDAYISDEPYKTSRWRRAARKKRCLIPIVGVGQSG